MKTYWSKLFCLILVFFALAMMFSQQKITGKTMSENDMVMSNVLVVNISNDKKTYSDSAGNFIIDGSFNDELRFIKPGYERGSKKIIDPEAEIIISLIRIPEEIEEVEIISHTGDLKIDSRRLTKIDKADELQKSIGLPKAPEVQREAIPTWGSVFAMGIPNIFDLYKMVSGDARRKKALYKFEDAHRYMDWVISRTDEDYFTELSIPKDNIKEFLGYAFLQNPRCIDFVKQENISGALFEIEKTVPEYVKRLENKTK